MKIINLIILLSIFGNSYAQQIYKADIGNAKTNDLHRIALTPEIKSCSNIDLSDVRIVDSKNREIPYVIINESVKKDLVDFVEYPIISQEIKPRKYTELIIDNSKQNSLSNISLCIANTEVEKLCTISGSNDREQWYAITNNELLYSLYDNDYTQIYKSIYFPPISYKYLKITINDLHSAPLQITKAGNFRGSVIAGKLVDVPNAKINISEDKQNKKTILKISFDNAQLLNRIDFDVIEPRFFKRDARILVSRTRTIKKRTETYSEELFSFTLNSNAPLWYDLPVIKEKEITIEIENKDNLPLKFNQTRLKQLATYLVADLKANEKYSLVFGDNKLQSPQYDLNYFIDKIPQQLPELSIESITKISNQDTKTKNENANFWQQKWFMWLCIGLASIVIIYFSTSLLKDMKNKE